MKGMKRQKCVTVGRSRQPWSVIVVSAHLVEPSATNFILIHLAAVKSLQRAKLVSFYRHKVPFCGEKMLLHKVIL